MNVYYFKHAKYKGNRKVMTNFQIYDIRKLTDTVNSLYPEGWELHQVIIDDKPNVNTKENKK